MTLSNGSGLCQWIAAATSPARYTAGAAVPFARGPQERRKTVARAGETIYLLALIASKLPQA
jgi:hypothetical protein